MVALDVEEPRGAGGGHVVCKKSRACCAALFFYVRGGYEALRKGLQVAVIFRWVFAGGIDVREVTDFDGTLREVGNNIELAAHCFNM